MERFIPTVVGQVVKKMDFWLLKSKLPVASQSFARMRKLGKVYVDKTEFVYHIAYDDWPKIFSRPRRFGKSTLQSTLVELFLHGVAPYDGHDSYFKGLAIEQLWQDQGHYLVLHLDFQKLNVRCDTVERFEQKLAKAFVEFCQAHDLTVSENPLDVWDLFQALLDQLEDGSLVLLVDEYDEPLLKFIDNKEELAACKELLRSLFALVKSNGDKFRCVFFTGITRYHDLGLGTASNAFTDLTNDADFAASCGYTRAEVKQYFAENLRYAAAVRTGCAPEAVNDTQIEALLDEMSEWYDGYSFDGSQQNNVFSTWSVLRFFSDRKARFQGYWSSEEPLGVPQLLKVTLDRIDLQQLLDDVAAGEIVVRAEDFLQSSLVNPLANPYSLMFQTGYLTLSQPFSTDGEEHLICPNQEIRLAFGKLMARRMLNISQQYTPDFVKRSIEALSSLDSERILRHLQDLFSEEPFVRYAITSESTVATLINIHLITLGYKPRREVVNTKGWADCVFDMPEFDLTVVFEYKYEMSENPKVLDGDLEAAVNQIKKRDYGNGALSQRRLARFGLVFCGHKNVRNIVRISKPDIIIKYQKSDDKVKLV